MVISERKNCVFDNGEVVNGLFSRYLCDRIEIGSGIHRYNTRNADDIKHRTFQPMIHKILCFSKELVSSSQCLYTSNVQHR